MAIRRMFSNRIINSARFLKMPASAQALYFHLGLQADDEGIAEGFFTMRTAGASEDDLRTLEEKGFIKILNEDLLTYIENWKEHNNVPPAKFKPSIHHDVLQEYFIANGIHEADNMVSTSNGKQKTSNEKQKTSNGKQISSNEKPKSENFIPGGSPRLGKDSIVQDRVGKNTTASRESTNLEYTSTPVDNSQQQPPLATRLASDGSFAKVVALYQDNIHPIANQVEADDLMAMFDDYGEEWVKRAIKEAARNNARSIKYITAILQNWYKRGVPDPWNYKPPGKGSQQRGQTQSERAAEICRGAMELLEAGG